MDQQSRVQMILDLQWYKPVTSNLAQYLWCFKWENIWHICLTNYYNSFQKSGLFSLIWELSLTYWGSERLRAVSQGQLNNITSRLKLQLGSRIPWRTPPNEPQSHFIVADRYPSIFIIFIYSYKPFFIFSLLLYTVTETIKDCSQTLFPFYNSTHPYLH